MSKLKEKHNLKGTLICVEGIDGSGKSTQLALLRDWLKSIGQDVIFTEWNSSALICQTTKLAKKKNNGQGQNEGRGQNGQCGDGLKEALAGHIGAGDGERENITDEGGDHRHHHAQSHRAAEGLEIPGSGE